LLTNAVEGDVPLVFAQHVVGRLFYPCKPGMKAPGAGAGHPKRGLPWISQLGEATGRPSCTWTCT
jgi:hypothetical protein